MKLPINYTYKVQKKKNLVEELGVHPEVAELMDFVMEMYPSARPSPK
jgi:hypothetical protein